MIVFLIAVLVVVVGLVVAVVVGRVGTDSMAAPTRTASFNLPPGPVGSNGMETVRFDQALRGYNMSQVDQVLDRLFDEIADLEDELARAHGSERGEFASHESLRAPTEHVPGDVVQFRHRRESGATSVRKTSSGDNEHDDETGQREPDASGPVGGKIDRDERERDVPVNEGEAQADQDAHDRH